MKKIHHIPHIVALFVVAATLLQLQNVTAPTPETTPPSIVPVAISVLPLPLPSTSDPLGVLSTTKNIPTATVKNEVTADSKLPTLANKNAASDPEILQNPPTSYAGMSVSAREIITPSGQSYPNRVYETFLVPNDPLYNQWWVTPMGMTSVWDATSFASQVKIAVIDTGFALNHQEFTNRWATNNGELGIALSEGANDLNCTDRGLALNQSCNNIDDNYDGIVDNESGATSRQNPSKRNCTSLGLPLNKNCNNIDDDGNGYIDDWRGWDFANFDASAQAGETNPTGSGTAHGTTVTGILGATGNNGVGIAGVNWYAKILPLQALNDDSYGDTYTVSNAVRYAADQGADIISISLGTSADDPYMRLAILYALDRGSIVVAAAGNDGCNCIAFPANYPEVLAVGAISPSGTPATFSSYGANLDILAPGQSMVSPTYSSSNLSSAYATVSGTSFATPYFSGLLGLAKASQPTASWEELIGALFENSNKAGLSAISPRSDTLGFGITRSSTMLNRIRSPHSTLLRYQFGGGTILGSTRAYQCDSSTVPSTRYYQLTRSGQYRYTANLRELSKAIASGWTAQQIATTCIGLPGDSVNTTRTIDIPRELLNLQIKQ